MTVSEEELGVRHILSAKDMTNPEVDHIALMAYTAWHAHANTRQATPPPTEQPPRASVLIEPTPEPVVSQPREISVNVLDRWRVGAATTFTVGLHPYSPFPQPTCHQGALLSWSKSSKENTVNKTKLKHWENCLDKKASTALWVYIGRHLKWRPWRSYRHRTEPVGRRARIGQNSDWYLHEWHHFLSWWAR